MDNGKMENRNQIDTAYRFLLTANWFMSYKNRKNRGTRRKEKG